MKKLSILFVFFAIIMFGCEEIVPPIDSTIRPTGRRVLIEEFTGVQCVNCPKGSKRLEELAEQYKGFVIPISIHAGSFSEPYNESLYDFRTPEGKNIEGTLLGPIQGFPAATINRRHFDDEPERPLTLSKWAGYLIQELLKDPELEITINNNYTASNRNLEIEVELDFATTVDEPLGISIMILEDKIADYQLTEDKDLYPPNGKNPDYVHRHVLRTMLTDYTGDAILSSQTVEGANPTFNYTFTMPDEWNIENCDVVAFVSHKSGTLDVIQANIEHLN